MVDMGIERVKDEINKNFNEELMRLRKTVPELKDSIVDSINKQISETTEVIKNKTTY